MIFLGCLAAPPDISANDMKTVFKQAEALFEQGKHKEAKPLLEQVVAADPRHTQAEAMLLLINNQGPTLADQLSSVTLPRVEFADVSLSEALEGLKALAKDASGGKVVPNFIVRGDEAKTRRISLSLQNVPLSEAIRYVAELAGAACRYEAKAVVFSTE